MSLFGESIHLQVSEVHLCADVVGFDFFQVNYEEHFVTRVRKNDTIYSASVDGVSLDCHKVSTLRFSSHGSPLSCTIYNKSLEIKQKSGKTWFYDLWCKGVDRVHGGTWDGESQVWGGGVRPYSPAFLAPPTRAQQDERHPPLLPPL